MNNTMNLSLICSGEEIFLSTIFGNEENVSIFAPPIEREIRQKN